MSVQTVLGDVLLLTGVLLMLVAGIGLVRLPDLYNRTNAVAKAGGLGLVMVLLGVVVLDPGPAAVVVLLLSIALQLFTVPIAGFEIGQAARLSGAPFAPGTRVSADRAGLPDGEPGSTDDGDR
ncbi:monovalent cation/H(+) antiporter subunit G [Modestobacter sp. Leaf380]|uniref:cation:proton antiporter n=1 Tax=Modestobacter sp. Leaf380 TaxID=1736356 RepID=UPI0009E85494|nr:monovalent cation/H(+) antiporter subunit G [Modestobacter sp. Leaf380]